MRLACASWCWSGLKPPASASLGRGSPTTCVPSIHHDVHVTEERLEWPPAGVRVRDDWPITIVGEGREVDLFMPVVCSNRGQHHRARLTTVIREMSGELHMPRAFEAFAPPLGDLAEEGELGSRDSYTFWCRRCSRTPVVEPIRWWNLVLRHAYEGIERIDVSFLD